MLEAKGKEAALKTKDADRKTKHVAAKAKDAAAKAKDANPKMTLPAQGLVLGIFLSFSVLFLLWQLATVYNLPSF